MNAKQLCYYISDSFDVYSNLALEEYFVRNYDFTDTCLLLVYRNSSSIVLGKNQNFFQETHLNSFLTSDYRLARRISGGGTVVHDIGNVNFAFFEKHDLKNVNNYESSTIRMTQVLNQLGIGATMNERNAIILDNGKKVSGSAQFSSSQAILSHFTLLYASNLDKIDDLIRPNKFQITTKASPSVRSSIDNLQNHTTISIDDFIMQSIEILGYDQILKLENTELKMVEHLRNEKYSSPQFYFDTACSGQLQNNKVTIELEKGHIKRLEGIASENYLNRRLFLTEFDRADAIWQALLHD
jgi:lipoate-protein ligase A